MGAVTKLVIAHLYFRNTYIDIVLIGRLSPTMFIGFLISSMALDDVD